MPGGRRPLSHLNFRAGGWHCESSNSRARESCARVRQEFAARRPSVSCFQAWAFRYVAPDQCLSLAKLVFLFGASRTVLQAGGRSESMTGFGGFAGGAGLVICGRSTLSENQWLSSLALQPSSPDTGGCVRQFGESAGQRNRTWMWSWCPNQGRTLAIQRPSRALSSTRHNSFLIAAFTNTRSTAGCWAAVLMKATCWGVQVFGLRCFQSSETRLIAEMVSRSSLVNSWSGIGMNQISTSRPI